MTHWTWVAASCRGVSHARTGSRLEDAFACFTTRSRGTELVTVVSDGAGSAALGRHGAVLTCRAIALCAREHFSASSTLPSDEEVWGWVDGIRDWIGTVATRRRAALRDFAATLVCAISNGHETLVAHVGDGSVAVRDRATDQWTAASWPEHGEYASTTYFVTDDAGAKLRISRHGAEIDALAVFSDGIERLALDLSSQQPYSPFLNRMAAPVTASRVMGRDGELSRKLKQYLDADEINTRTDDDKTLIIATSR